MKKIGLLLLICLPLLLAQTVVYTNAAVVAWDAVTKLADGSPVPTGDAISYEVLRAPAGNKASAVVVGETPQLQFAVTFPSEGDWVVGVRAVRTTGTERLMSDINWSDVGGTPNPFVLRYYRGPAVPGNLRLQ